MKRIAFATALAMAAPNIEAATMSVFHLNDPEALHVHWDEATGRVSFRKPGIYLGDKIGCVERLQFNYIRQDGFTQVFDGKCREIAPIVEPIFAKHNGILIRGAGLVPLTQRHPAWRSAVLVSLAPRVSGRSGSPDEPTVTVLPPADQPLAPVWLPATWFFVVSAVAFFQLVRRFR
ncbi:hypothetical protein [uncultured Roseobacter sp.]|uniref:hypothetical protein n=1 Tax=uncultured Roseobacter sp. TaxID=114847 RepID=UPI00262F054C|nr:hypothetical protein [uncultured Roseobacter sp.]